MLMLCLVTLFLWFLKSTFKNGITKWKNLEIQIWKFGFALNASKNCSVQMINEMSKIQIHTLKLLIFVLVVCF